MKKISLIFPGLGYKNINQSLVYIYDKNNKLLLEDETYNGKVEVCLEENKSYIIKAISKYEKIKSIIYINSSNKYCIPFKSSYVCRRNENTITFLLTDYNYENLPIEKGMISVWQRQ